MDRFKYFLKTPLRVLTDRAPVFANKPTRTTGHGLNLHKSNRAKEGLYHGKDVRFGHSISHSHRRSKRMWKPNVQNKRLWSDELDQWVRFKVTTRAMKEIDYVGGLDNYLLALNERDVANSNYITKMRDLIASSMFHKGTLKAPIIKRLGYHKNPPPAPTPST